MARYKPKTKVDAIARLWVTASPDGAGSWVPNFQSVEVGMRTDGHSESPDRRTLKRWWVARDVSKDAHYRALQITKRTEAADRGATVQVLGMLSVLKRRLADILQDDAGWADEELGLTAKTQAAINMTRALALAAPLLGTDEGKQDDTKSKAARFAERVSKTKP